MALATEAVGWAGLASVYLASYAATIALPGTLAPGYCIDPSTGKPQLYRLNGFASLTTLTTLFLALVGAGVVPGDFFHVHFWSCLRASCCLGLALSTLFFLRGRALLRGGSIDRRPRCPTADAPEGGPVSDTAEFDARSSLEHWYCGLSEYNPRGPGGVDVKMSQRSMPALLPARTDLVSAVFAATGGSGSSLFDSPGLLATAGCLTFFVFEYCWHELVHTCEASAVDPCLKAPRERPRLL